MVIISNPGSYRRGEDDWAWAPPYNRRTASPVCTKTRKACPRPCETAPTPPPIPLLRWGDAGRCRGLAEAVMDHRQVHGPDPAATEPLEPLDGLAAVDLAAVAALQKLYLVLQKEMVV